MRVPAAESGRGFGGSGLSGAGDRGGGATLDPAFGAALREFGLRRLGRRWAAAGYPEEQLLEETAFVAYHFHWPREEVLALEHRERRAWAEEISKINERMNREGAALAAP